MLHRVNPQKSCFFADARSPKTGLGYLRLVSIGNSRGGVQPLEIKVGPSGQVFSIIRETKSFAIILETVYDILHSRSPFYL